MVEPITELDPDRIRDRLTAVREGAGEGVEVLVASKYVTCDRMDALIEAGVTLVGENRLQDLAEKQDRWGDALTWDFIGNLQSRKAAEVHQRSRLVHSLASKSARDKLAAGGRELLVQVNVAGESGKAGIEPQELGEFIAGCAAPVTGLSTMPPYTEDPEASRRWFARLAELAAEHGLARLSMGTSQDWRVAVAEGATIIRLGSALLR